MPTVLLLLRVELTSVKPASIIAEKASAAGNRERPPLKADKDRKFIIESHFAGRKSLM
jgi:hypothetical protein